MGGGRMRMPAPCRAFWLLGEPRIAVRSDWQEGGSPMDVPLCEGSGSYKPRIDACAKISVPPSDAGCLSLPSIFVGRPMWLSTRIGLAYPPSVMAVA